MRLIEVRVNRCLWGPPLKLALIVVEELRRGLSHQIITHSEQT